MLLLPGAAHADALTQYTVQVLAQNGVSTPGFNPIGKFFAICRMNNHDQIALVTKTQESKGRQVLGVLANGQFTPIATAGGPSPDGKTWPATMSFGGWWADINDSGNVAFTPVDSSGNFLGVYFWDAVKQTVIPLVLSGTPATGDLVITKGGLFSAVLNNRDEVAFIAHVKPASGSATDGIFLRRADGQIDPVVLPGEPLPGQSGSKTAVSPFLGLNDAGQVSFSGSGTGSPATNSAYLWENGVISLQVEGGTAIAGLGKCQGFNTFGPNDQNSNVLLTTWTASSPGTGGLLLWRQGQIVPVLLDGQVLPGGGKFVGGEVDMGLPNTLGQYPFVVGFAENGKTGSGAYVIGADGNLSLIARTGMTTPLGALTRISPALNTSDAASGIQLDEQGQVALTAQIDNGPDVILLLTPNSPAGNTSP
jgi:hypothetical protein